MSVYESPFTPHRLLVVRASSVAKSAADALHCLLAEREAEVAIEREAAARTEGGELADESCLQPPRPACKPASAYGCCDGRQQNMGIPSYYCDVCNLYYHPLCQPNMSRGRQAPLCPSCHQKALEGSDRRSTRHRR